MTKYAKSVYGNISNRLLLGSKNGSESSCGILKCISFIFLLPISIFAFHRCVIEDFYFKRPDLTSITGCIRKSILNILQKSGFTDYKGNKLEDITDIEKQDYFKYVYHYVLENTDYHRPKVHNYISLFGFYRNFCLVLIASFWVAGLYIILHGIHLELTIEIVSFVILANLVFIGYFKFYRRYILEVFMAAVFSESHEKVCKCSCNKT